MAVKFTAYIYNKVSARLLALLVPAAVCLAASAQTDAQLSQYYELPNFYNPAATGTTDFLKLRADARLQWLGVDNAPQTFTVAADMPFKFIGKRFGTGLVMQQESYGLYKHLDVAAQLSYKLKLFKGELSIGVQPGFVNQSFKGTDVFIPDQDDYHQGTDDAIPQQDISGNAFDLAAGLFYTHRLFWLGVSGRHLTQPSIRLNAESGEDTNEKNYEFPLRRTLYFMAGSNIPIKNTLFELQPSALVRSDFTFTSWEATLRYNKFISAGVGYRWKDAVYAVVAAEIKGFYIGFSYDYPTGAIARATSGSYEIMAGYQLKLDFSERNRHRHKSVRIM